MAQNIRNSNMSTRNSSDFSAKPKCCVAVFRQLIAHNYLHVIIVIIHVG